MADSPKIVGTDSLKLAYPKINQAIDNANQAKSEATTALNTANSVQTQFNQVVIEGDSSVEAAQARVDENGVTKTTLKGRIDDGFININSILDEKTNDLNSRGINIKYPPAPLIGAKGDGVTDDTNAFNGLYTYLSDLGGGTIYADGVFSIVGSIELKPNVHLVLSPTTVITKEHATDNFYAFTGLSRGNKGYGSGSKNNSIKGGKFYGGFSSGKSLSLTFHHCEGLVFEDVTFEECNTVAHAVDLAGCNDVRFTRCNFIGFNLQTGREYTEAIQIDFSSYDSIAGLDTAGSYDGLPTKDVVVEDCKFLPVYNANGSIKYPAPNPIGSHSLIENTYYSNINFLRNKVVDCPNSNVAGAYVPGWIHFLTVDGVRIEDNEFINTLSINCQALGFYTLNNAKALADVENSNVNISTTPKPSKNIRINRNKFKGFKSQSSIDIVRCLGILNSNDSLIYYMDNIKFEDNEFEDCYTQPASGYDGSGTGFTTKYANRIYCRKNKAKDIKRLINSEYGEIIECDSNEVDGGHYVPILINQFKKVVIGKNKLKNYRGGLFLTNLNTLNIIENQISDDLPGATSTFPQVIAVNAATGVIAKNNQIFGAVSTAIVNGFRVYNTSSKGIISDNIISGFATQVNQEVGSTVTLGSNF
jgi:hypothetical protein